MKRSLLINFLLANILLTCFANAESVVQNQSAESVQKPRLSFTDSETLALQKALKQYKELSDNGGWPEWQVGKKITAGDSDDRIPTLRNLLTITSDYAPIATISAESQHYDDTLVEAVKHFQARHGLNADGTLGKSTQTALAVPVSRRIAQIIVTLERIKNNPELIEPKFILVNLPGYTLYGMEQEKTALQMRVIIGNKDNHTPLFDKVVTDIVFNPPWNVPARIARNELMPKLRENPAYFINAGFTVTQDGIPIDPMSVSANTEDDNLSFRQQPGHGNALGKIKFNIPDSDDIYLHSTANPQLFAKEERALSHGCVRLEKPRDLAHFVLGDEAGWDSAKIDHMYDSTTEHHVAVTEVPVHLVYWTAFVDEQGVAYFYDDIYGKDNAVEARMKDTESTTIVAAE